MGEPAAGDDKLVDTRGHRCPIPTLRLGRALKRVSEGDSVVLLADDPMARIDVVHYAASQGHTVIAITDEAGVLRFTLRRGPDTAA